MPNEPTPLTPFEAAIYYFRGVQRMAAKLVVSESSVRRWNATRPPEHICQAIERLSDGEIKADMLRPDINFIRDRKGVVVDWRLKSAVTGGGES